MHNPVQLHRKMEESIFMLMPSVESPTLFASGGIGLEK
jgi:hypothetical protein